MSNTLVQLSYQHLIKHLLRVTVHPCSSHTSSQPFSLHIQQYIRTQLNLIENSLPSFASFSLSKFLQILSFHQIVDSIRNL
ncbi:hypothetical protein L1987_37410 [Smallanthus sonchifolius]|uniref:Uncharacterized protein n=1 Tax=Smallanthus sonchifolius TaxID=185202 RepID=A0ACB9HIV2_9ASTR|nr:hypothetical protein L1987_37410 [Smallanthus sonchifolius]